MHGGSSRRHGVELLRIAIDRATRLHLIVLPKPPDTPLLAGFDVGLKRLWLRLVMVMAIRAGGRPHALGIVPAVVATQAAAWLAWLAMRG